MKVAVLSDIHGNHKALEAVLAHAAADGAEAYVVLGDHISDGPYPCRTMDMLYELEKQAPTYLLRGNREEYMLEHRAGGGEPWLPGTESGSLYYTYSQLRESDLDRFAALPNAMPVVFRPGESFLAVHGSPQRSRERLLPHDEASLRYMEACRHPALLCGHSHRYFIYPHRGVLLANPGSVGLSTMGTAEARYAMLTFRGRYWHCDLRGIPYDIEAVVADMIESGLAEIGCVWSRCVIATLRTGKSHIIPTGSLAYRLAQEHGHTGNWLDIPPQYWREAAERLGVPAV